MLIKVKKAGEDFQLCDTFIGPIATVNESSWEMIKAVKKHGADKAVTEIANLFEIDKETAKEDIDNVIETLKDIGVKVEDISLKVSDEEYAPRSVEFVISPECNCECIYCQSSWTRDNKIALSTEQIKTVLTDLSTIGCWCAWVECGGVLLRKDIFEIFSHAEEIEMAVVIFISGSTVNDDIAKKLASYKNLRVQVNLDSCIAKHHDFQRGLPGDFEKSVEGIKTLKKHGIVPQVAMIVTKYNLDDVKATADFVHNLGIEYFFLGPTGYFYGRANENKDFLRLNSLEIKKLKDMLVNVQEKYKDKMIVSLST